MKNKIAYLYVSINKGEIVNYIKLARNKRRRDKRKSYKQLKEEELRLKKLQEQYLKEKGKTR